MVSFLVYDVIFLIVFSLFITWFLYKNQKSLGREAKVMFLYRAQWGVRAINYIGSRYKKFLLRLKYPIIAVGYILMAGVIYLISRSVYLYLRYPQEITDAIKAPPIAPVIPYFPKLFGLESFFPPFYFTYFILALAIVAIVHEFSHGIFMNVYKVRIKSTGIVFLGPILGAFVEQEEKDMLKIKNTEQMAILGAGVFANVITAGIFLLLWIGLFYMAFIPVGSTFNTYLLDVTEKSSVDSIGGIVVQDLTDEQILEILQTEQLSEDVILEIDAETLTLTRVTVGEQNYLMRVDGLGKAYSSDSDFLLVYYDLPAIRAGLHGTIVGVDGESITSTKELSNLLQRHAPGDRIVIQTESSDVLTEFDIVLGNSPYDESKPIIGIGSRFEQRSIEESLAFFKSPSTEYIERHSFLSFIYYLVFWIFLLNLLVAFFNMLPLSILDGGRFFYLTVLGISGKEATAKRAFKVVGLIILFAFLLMMSSWLFGLLG